ncbi:hypothetical protein JVX93_21595 [Mycolicibacterium boenickei]|nr:hypothetical protein JVX93_21595 [Mycolicibacterium boenickei]
MIVMDTRLIGALNDTKAGADSVRFRHRAAAAAAFDDARTRIHELLNEGTKAAVPVDVRADLDADLGRYEEALKLLELGQFAAAGYVAKVIIGDLVMVTERWK